MACAGRAPLHSIRAILMADERLQYKGYTIVLMPATDNGELWFGGYESLKDGEKVRERNHLSPCFPYYAAAHNGSVEHAKIGIENIIST